MCETDYMLCGGYMTYKDGTILVVMLLVFPLVVVPDGF